MEELHSSLLDKAAMGVGRESLGEEVGNVVCEFNFLYFKLPVGD